MHNSVETTHAQVVELLRLQADAIQRMTHRLQPAHVERAVGFLAACHDKVLLIGTGKSGIVARKIAATLTSTGTVGVYLHPSEALHGDLGIVTAEDVALVFSNSGETDEVLTLLPYLTHRQVPIIAIVGNLHSTLARRQIGKTQFTARDFLLIKECARALM